MGNPAPRPPALKLLNGRSEGRDSGGRKVPTPPAYKRLPPRKPTWLSSDASAEWDRVLPELERLEIVKEMDGVSLANYCEAFAVWRMATDIVHEHGLMVINSGKDGAVQHAPNPVVAVMLKASMLIKAWAVEFGFTPSAENRMGKEGGSGGEEGSAFD